MKVHRKKVPLGHSFVFNHQRPQNLLRVQYDETGVLIIAARDNFSHRDKVFFVRHLVAEGFLEDEGSPAPLSAGTHPNLRWEVEPPQTTGSWSARRSQTSAFMIRLLVCGSLLWLLELTVLVLTRL